MGGFLQLAGGIIVTIGGIAALAGVVTATPFSQGAAFVSAAIWLVSSTVSGCVLIALGQLHDRVNEMWSWMRAQQAAPIARVEAVVEPSVKSLKDGQPATRQSEGTPDLSGALGGRAALWAKFEPATTQAEKKD